MAGQRGGSPGPKILAVLRGAPDVQRDLRVARRARLSPAEFDALPTETQELLIADEHLELEARRAACPSCGAADGSCADHTKVRYPQRQVCWVAADRAAAERQYADLHEAEPYHDGTFGKWSKTATPATPYHFNDGVTITVSDRDEHPDDDFLTKGGGVIRGRPQGEGPPRA